MIDTFTLLLLKVLCRRVLNLKFLLTLFILLHLVSKFSFHTLTIPWAELCKKYLQYFQNTMQGSMMRVFSMLLKYFQDTIRNSIELYTQCIQHTVSSAASVVDDWALSVENVAVAASFPLPRPTVVCSFSDHALPVVKWEGIFKAFTLGGTETVPQGRVVHLSFVRLFNQSRLITLKLWVCTVSLLYEQRSVLRVYHRFR